MMSKMATQLTYCSTDTALQQQLLGCHQYMNQGCLSEKLLTWKM